jgi:hypothetical protein
VTKKEDEILCKVDPKDFRYINTNLVNFSQTLKRFVRHMVSNKNWVGTYKMGGRGQRA